MLKYRRPYWRKRAKKGEKGPEIPKNDLPKRGIYGFSRLFVFKILTWKGSLLRMG
jgi:hypothetical protein